MKLNQKLNQVTELMELVQVTELVQVMELNQKITELIIAHKN